MQEYLTDAEEAGQKMDDNLSGKGLTDQNTEESEGSGSVRDLLNGLTDAEVAERVAAGKINGDVNIKTKSVARILRTNIVTFFNILFLNKCVKQ